MEQRGQGCDQHCEFILESFTVSNRTLAISFSERLFAIASPVVVSASRWARTLSHSAKKYGKPTKSEESTMTNLRGDRFDNIVEKWRLENTVIVLGSRGEDGKSF
jgi:hypothetical protein